MELKSEVMISKNPWGEVVLIHLPPEIQKIPKRFQKVGTAGSAFNNGLSELLNVQNLNNKTSA